jgi:predicted amidohydrolase
METENLRVSIVQYDIVWGEVKQNLLRLDKILSSAKGKTDLLILPEMFTSGFMMKQKAEIAPQAYTSIEWMKEQSIKLGAAIIGSIIVEENGNYYNRVYCFYEGDKIAQYDKRHLFRMGNEHEHFAAGNQRCVFNLKGWRICPMICYDLRFPVWSRNKNEYDLLLYMANWPKPRREVWNVLLKARAIENQAYAVGVNRVGEDGMNLSYTGDSAIIDAKGKLLLEAEIAKEQLLTFELIKKDLDQFREKFPVHFDSDDFKIIN